MVETIKTLIRSLLTTKEKQEKAFNFIFYLSAASLLISGIFNAIDNEAFSYVLGAIVNIINLGCLYVACLFFIRKEKPMVTTVLAAVFAAWGFFVFADGWSEYRYYSFRENIFDIIISLAAIGGAVLLIVYQTKRSKGEKVEKIYEYLLYAGVAYMAFRAVDCVVTFITVLYYALDYHYFSLGLLLENFFLLILLQIPKLFIILGIWLAVDLVHEQEAVTREDKAELEDSVASEDSANEEP